MKAPIKGKPLSGPYLSRPAKSPQVKLKVFGGKICPFLDLGLKNPLLSTFYFR
jgi:hypothetical protein